MDSFVFFYIFFKWTHSFFFMRVQCKGNSQKYDFQCFLGDGYVHLLDDDKLLHVVKQENIHFFDKINFLHMQIACLQQFQWFHSICPPTGEERRSGHKIILMIETVMQRIFNLQPIKCSKYPSFASVFLSSDKSRLILYDKHGDVSGYLVRDDDFIAHEPARISVFDSANPLLFDVSPQCDAIIVIDGKEERHI